MRNGYSLGELFEPVCKASRSSLASNCTLYSLNIVARFRIHAMKMKAMLLIGVIQIPNNAVTVHPIKWN